MRFRLSTMLLALALPAAAAELSDQDLAFLRDQLRIEASSPVVSSLTGEQREELHRRINDPMLKDDPEGLKRSVRAYLASIPAQGAWDFLQGLFNGR